MARLVVSFAVAVRLVLTPAPAAAPAASPVDGAWMLNRGLSEMPREIGFNVNWFPTPSADGRGGTTSSGGGGRGGRRGSTGGGGSAGSAGPFSQRPESYEESRRVQLLTAEARNP